jgi:hypothetical protein
MRGRVPLYMHRKSNHSYTVLSVVVADKGYNSEANNEFVREHFNARNIIPARYGEVPVWRIQ